MHASFAPPSLTDLPELQAMLTDPQQLFTASKSATGPLAIALPSQVESAIASFHTLFDELSISANIYAAHKAATSQAAIASVKGRARIDVASPGELASALSHGFDSAEILATGPKTDDFLMHLTSHGILISIDSFEELERLSGILAVDATQKILLRLTRSLLNMPGIVRKSRFGLDRRALNKAVKFIQNDGRFELVGVCYHIDTASLDEKYYAATRCFEELLRLQASGFEAHVMNIGGGFGMDYGQSQAQSQALVASLKEGSAANNMQTWQNISYGLQKGMGEIKGIDMQSPLVGPERLRALLLRQDSAGQSLAQSINENLVELWIEPGSAIFGASEVMITPVIESKYSDGEYLVVVDAHRNQICFENNEAPLDPILLTQSPQSQPVEAFVAGHLCIESDFLTYRKIPFTSVPQPGDLLLWTHTGAYRSSFSASRAIGHPFQRRVVYSPTQDSYILKDETS